MTLIGLLLLVAVGAILYQYRYIFSYLRFRRVMQSVNNIQKDEPSKSGRKRECPKCCEEMEEGYLINPNRVYGSKGPFHHVLHGFYPPFLRSTWVDNSLSQDLPFLGGVRAYKCGRCGIFIW